MEYTNCKMRTGEKIWVVVNSLLVEHGRGGEWYKHVEFDALAIASRAGVSVTTARKYLNMWVDNGVLAKYEVSPRCHFYMFEVYNAG